MTILHLPYPPSVNTYWRHPTTGKLAGRHLISEKGRKYRADVCWSIPYAIQKLSGRLRVTIECFPPDKRRRDLDNVAKGLLDALSHAGVWHDDEQIDDLRIVRRETTKGGAVRVRIEPMEAAA
ncbi:RusA family crossover junction endodeoxyribonuclease [Pseudomonas sp. S36]|uniref:RusA family crossover junction endodeoxyribonuclease n=1 Tax=Pseudomonas sp. S36 TaxID=2767447 RepID=UPI00191354E6|nr:RusA family crossover junction endodeoxyribonuclease [Pseudomonas sp. S36]MBK4989785.1 RusA family crossover junction endodeoxyribonuclease [Pseudomonas sp. S36]